MFIYYYRIYDRYRKEIAALAIFTDDTPSFQPSAFKLAFLDTELKYKFGTYKLYNKAIPDFYTQKNNPFSIIMETAWCELHKKGNLDNLHSKTEIARKLFNKGFSKSSIEKLLNFLRYYFRLQNSKKECIFESKLTNFVALSGKKTTMGIEEAILTDVKRQGIEQAQKEMVKNLFAKEFSIEKIQDMLALPIDLILQVKEELEE